MRARKWSGFICKWLSECPVSLTERRKKSVFDCAWFSRKMTVLEDATMCFGSILHVDNDSEGYRTLFLD